MISLFRIDERLIHGQIAIKWSKHLSVTHIIVANEHAAKNDLIQKSLRMAAPSNIKVAIKGIQDSIDLLNDPRAAGLKILLLVNNPDDALTIVNAVKAIDKINVGNYGRVAPEKAGKKRKAYTQNIFCDDDEAAAFRALIDTGLEVYYQVTPEHSKQDLNTIFK